MAAPVDQSVVARLKAERENRKVADLTREFAGRIATATKRWLEARKVYDLHSKEDIPELIGAASEVLKWHVRRQTLIECWELATGKVWAMGTFKDE